MPFGIQRAGQRTRIRLVSAREYEVVERERTPAGNMPTIRKVSKLWGRELWHHNSGGYCMKTLELRTGAAGSLHYHKLKRETFLVTAGKVTLEIREPDAEGKYGDTGTRLTLMPGDSYTLEPCVAHRFSSYGHAQATVVEASTEHKDEDVYRLEPSKFL